MLIFLLLTACKPDGEATGEPPRSNVPPALVSVHLEPEPAYAADEIAAIVDAIDLDDDVISLRYAWYVDGDEQITSEPTLPAFSGIHGQVVELTVSLSDGFSFGVPQTVELTIQNTPSVVTSVSIEPADATVESVLRCEAVHSDDDGDEADWSYTWYVDSAEVQSSGSELLKGAFTKGQTVSCEAWTNDGYVDSASLRSDEITIQNTPPGPPEIGVSPEPPSPCLDGGAFVTVESEDADGDAITYAFAWYDDAGTEVLTGDTYPAETFIQDASYSLVVTPSDDEEAGEPAQLDFIASGGGEQLGNDIDDDCDGQVDEWLDYAWQAQQMYWGDEDGGQLGYGLAAGDVDGDGLGDLALARGGESDVQVVLGASVDPDHPRIEGPDLTIADVGAAAQMWTGDADGDGVVDLLVGAPGYNGAAGTDSGAVFLLYGGTFADGEIDAVAGWWVEGDDNEQELGRYVGFGDLDGDGLAEVVTSDINADAPSRDAGEVYVFHDLSAASLADADAILEGTNREVYFGSALAVVGDVDGDGYGELAVGGPGADDGDTDGGLVAVWWGGASGIASGAYDAADALIVASDDDAAIGSEPSAAADIDGDGLADLASAHRADTTVGSPGTIAIFSGADLAAGGSFTPGDAFASVASTQANGWLGLDGTGPALADLDGDGLAELAAGASGEGRIYMWRSGTLGPGGDFTTADADVSIGQEDSGDQFSRAVAFSDTDGDGVPDLVAAGWRSDVGAETGGAAYVFRPRYGYAAEMWEPGCERVGDLLYCREAASWDDARLTCQIFGGDLARLDSDALAAEAGDGAAARSIPGTERGLWWIGLNESSGSWAWLDDKTAATWTSWGGSAPTGAGDCAVTNEAGPGLWSDRSCDEAYFFVCDI